MFKWCTSGSEVIKLALFSCSFFGQDSLSLAMMHFLGRRGTDPQSLWPTDDQMELEHLFIYQIYTTGHLIKGDYGQCKQTVKITYKNHRYIKKI